MRLFKAADMGKKNKSEITFDDAVEIARRLLSSIKTQGPFDPRAKNADGALKAGLLQVHGFVALDKDPAALIKKARRSADAFDALRFGIAHSLRANLDIPWDAKVWLAEYLTDQRTRPISTAGRKSLVARDIQVWLAVRYLVDKGMFATRSLSSPATSACDAVAAALKQLGETPQSYLGVKNKWREMNAKRDPDGNFRNLFRGPNIS
jgi:hypothetical protein